MKITTTKPTFKRDGTLANATKAQDEVILMLEDGVVGFESGEAWLFEDGAMGVSYTDDGLTMTGIFDRDGVLVGNWM